jgi:F0F1-type ATP synthase gamma subunit
VNPRSLVKFYNSLRSISDFDKNLVLIQNIGEGAVGPEVTTMFTSFIYNKLDKMISPTEILDTTKAFDTIKAKVVDLIKSEEEYRGDLAYVLTTRLINHMVHNVENKEITPKFIERVKDLITSEILGSDLKFVLAKKVINANNKYNVLMLEDSIIDVILE